MEDCKDEWSQVTSAQLSPGRRNASVTTAALPLLR